MAGSDPTRVYRCVSNNNTGENKCKEFHVINIEPDEERKSTLLYQSDDENLSSDSLLSITKTIRQLVVAASCLVVSVLFNLTVLAVIHERVPLSQKPLPDVTFDLLPKVDRALDISEYIIMFMTASVLVITLLHRYRSIVFRRLCLVLCVLYLLRAICMAVTQLPVANPQYYCSPQLNLTENVHWWTFAKTILSRVSHMSLGMGLSVNGRHSFCGDYIFSGHTVMLVTTFLFLNEYWLSTRTSILWRLLKYTYFLLVCTGIICILIARGHYMVDIVLAYYISSRVFFIYHCSCDNVLIRPSCGDQRYRELFWYTIFTYVESDTIKHQIRVENNFDFIKIRCCR